MWEADRKPRERHPTLERVGELHTVRCATRGLPHHRESGEKSGLTTPTRVEISGDLAGAFSAVLFGPPGTGKTTLLRALAKSTGLPLITITPAELVVDGVAGVEQRAKAVMEALAMLTNCVILFDEFEPMLHSRRGRQVPHGDLELVTGNMLPKLAELNRAARKQRLVYALATNYFENLDDAATRAGRFDQWVCIFPPDAVSRAVRFVTAIYENRKRPPAASVAAVESRLAWIIGKTNNIPAAYLGEEGWFRAPQRDTRGRAPTPWAFALQEGAEPAWPVPTGESIPAEPTGGLKPGPSYFVQIANLELIRDVNMQLRQGFEGVFVPTSANHGWSKISQLAPGPVNLKRAISWYEKQMAAYTQNVDGGDTSLLEGRQG